MKRQAKLDRRVHFDERSRKFPIRGIVPAKPRSYTWSCPAHLDQGREGACVGFGWAHELIARPAVNTISEDGARSIYKLAKTLDAWPGDTYEGTSVIAGAKAVAQMGYMTEYRWAFGLDDLVLAVGYAGPAVLGVNWHYSMDEPQADGRIVVGDEIAGGHCILCNGVNVKTRMLRLHNSWGESWGLRGDCLISFDDMDVLLKEDGECCVPMLRKVVKP